MSMTSSCVSVCAVDLGGEEPADQVVLWLVGPLAPIELGVEVLDQLRPRRLLVLRRPSGG